MNTPAYLKRLADGLGLQANVASFLAQELASEHRHYHTIHHLALMQRYLRREADINHSSAVFAAKYWRNWMLAILFHDIVYDPTASDNEEASAQEMKLRIGNMKKVDIALIERMILATKSHHFIKRERYLADDDRAVNIFLRADLSILWAPRQTYEWYARGVRKEYAHVPNQLYRHGRAAVISKLVNELNPIMTMHEIGMSVSNVAWEKTQLETGALDV